MLVPLRLYHLVDVAPRPPAGKRKYRRSLIISFSYSRKTNRYECECLTLHISQRESFPAKTVGSPVDINNGLFPQCDPNHSLCRWMSILDSTHNFVNCLDSWLPQSIDVCSWHSSEINSTTDTIVNATPLTEPLVGLQQCTGIKF